jgi:class 3 adenylate cyclase/NAD(P)-dependent dehydrogenase (short-subunit alcohol dehydrogenase family)
MHDLLAQLGVGRDALAGRVALVTGAARGIGAETARLLAACGARVVCADILPSGARVAEEIGGEFVQCDVADPAQVLALTQRAGEVDILVNNSMTLVVAPVVQVSVDDWDRVFATNLRAAFLTIRELLPGMAARHRGTIVNLIAYEGSPLTAAYSATKVGLRSLALTTARELGTGSGVSVFAYIPGIVDTPGVRELLIPGLSRATGMSAEELTTSVLAQNPGYPALMPVEHCAAALVYSIVHAAEYHGQVVDPFEPLHRFGVIAMPDTSQHLPVAVSTEAALPQHLKEYLTNVTQLNRELEQRIELRTRELAEAHGRSEALLLNVLPRPIAERLKNGEGTIADYFNEVTVLFADIVGFTPMSAQLAPQRVVEILDAVFSAFDRVAGRHGLEKIKTIGDCYMMVGGLPEPRPDHADAVARAALDIIDALGEVGRAVGVPLATRIGMHTGAVVAGVIGRRKFIYDLWGDTVNTASRMESHGVANRVQCTEEVYRRLSDRYAFEPRGAVEVKGKGAMPAYFLLGVRD